MTGAVELISHAAAKMLASEMPTFLETWDRAMGSMSGNLSSSMQSSEDPMLELWARAAGVNIVADKSLLNDQVQFPSQCSPYEPTAAYYPLKTATSFRRCWLRANPNGSTAHLFRAKRAGND